MGDFDIYVGLIVEKCQTRKKNFLWLNSKFHSCTK